MSNGIMMGRFQLWNEIKIGRNGKEGWNGRSGYVFIWVERKEIDRLMTMVISENNFFTHSFFQDPLLPLQEGKAIIWDEGSSEVFQSWHSRTRRKCAICNDLNVRWKHRQLLGDDVHITVIWGNWEADKLIENNPSDRWMKQMNSFHFLQTLFQP